MRRHILVMVPAVLLAGSMAFAQEGPVDPNAELPPGHPQLAPGPVDPNAELPAGHPSMGDGNPTPTAPHAVHLPESVAQAAPDLPAGTLVVRVVDPAGVGVPNAPVRVGSMRDGERGDAMNVTTGPDGTATVHGLPTDGNTAFRVSTDADGARFGALPFQLGPTGGYNAQLVRFPVDHTGRGCLIWDARAEVHFHDDRVVVVERMRLVNLTGMTLGTERPSPTAFVPSNGLRFGLPRGYLAFNTQPSMSDLRVTDEDGAAVLRGSLPPTGREPTEVVFQYQVKLEGTSVDLGMALPLPVVTAMVVSEAPPGLTLSVDGMPGAEPRESQGQHVLLTGLERRPADPQLTVLHVHLGGIPAAAGLARWIAVVTASVLVLVGLLSVFRRRGAKLPRTKTELAAERARVLAEVTELARAHETGDVGPVTYARRRHELALWLASILKAEASLPAVVEG